MLGHAHVGGTAEIRRTERREDRMLKREVAERLRFRRLRLAEMLDAEPQVDQHIFHQRRHAVEQQHDAAPVVEIAQHQVARVLRLQVAGLDEQRVAVERRGHLVGELRRLEHARRPVAAHHLRRERGAQIVRLRQQRNAALAHRRQAEIKMIVRRERIGRAFDGHLAVDPESGIALPLREQAHVVRLAREVHIAMKNLLPIHAQRHRRVLRSAGMPQQRGEIHHRFVACEKSRRHRLLEREIGARAGSGRLRELHLHPF